MRVLLAVLVALLLGGCGGSSTTSSNPPPGPTSNATSTPRSANAAPPDACILVSQAQASEVVGTDVTKSDLGVGGATNCTYGPSSTGASFIVTAQLIPHASGLPAIRQSMFSALSGSQTINGIGDSAVEAKTAYDVKVAFWKGDVFVLLAAYAPALSGDSMAPKLESLAKSIAAKV